MKVGFWDMINIDEKVENSLSKMYPNFEFIQVASNLESVEEIIRKSELKTQKRFLGFIYGKEYEYSEVKSTIEFTKILTYESTYFNRKMIIYYGISNKKNTVYWKVKEYH